MTRQDQELAKALRENEREAAKLRKLREQERAQSLVCEETVLAARRAGATREQLLKKPFSHGKLNTLFRDAGLSGEPGRKPGK